METTEAKIFASTMHLWFTISISLREPLMANGYYMIYYINNTYLPKLRAPLADGFFHLLSV